MRQAQVTARHSARAAVAGTAARRATRGARGRRAARHDTVVTLPESDAHMRAATVKRVSQSGSWSSKVSTTCDGEPLLTPERGVEASRFSCCRT